MFWFFLAASTVNNWKFCILISSLANMTLPAGVSTLPPQQITKTVEREFQELLKQFPAGIFISISHLQSVSLRCSLSSLPHFTSPVILVSFLIPRLSAAVPHFLTLLPAFWLVVRSEGIGQRFGKEKREAEREREAGSWHTVDTGPFHCTSCKKKKIPARRRKTLQYKHLVRLFAMGVTTSFQHTHVTCHVK